MMSFGQPEIRQETEEISEDKAYNYSATHRLNSHVNSRTVLQNWN